MPLPPAMVSMLTPPRHRRGSCRCPRCPGSCRDRRRPGSSRCPGRRTPCCCRLPALTVSLLSLAKMRSAAVPAVMESLPKPPTTRVGAVGHVDGVVAAVAEHEIGPGAREDRVVAVGRVRCRRRSVAAVAVVAMTVSLPSLPKNSGVAGTGDVSRGSRFLGRRSRYRSRPTDRWCRCPRCRTPDRCRRSVLRTIESLPKPPMTVLFRRGGRHR